MRGRFGPTRPGDLDWTGWCGHEKVRLHFKLKSFIMKNSHWCINPACCCLFNYFETGMYCPHYWPHSLVTSALLEKWLIGIFFFSKWHMIHQFLSLIRCIYPLCIRKDPFSHSQDADQVMQQSSLHVGVGRGLHLRMEVMAIPRVGGVRSVTAPCSRADSSFTVQRFSMSLPMVNKDVLLPKSCRNLFIS